MGLWVPSDISLVDSGRTSGNSVFRRESMFTQCRKVKRMFEEEVKDIQRILLVTGSFRS